MRTKDTAGWDLPWAQPWRPEQIRRMKKTESHRGGAGTEKTFRAITRLFVFSALANFLNGERYLEESPQGQHGQQAVLP